MGRVFDLRLSCILNSLFLPLCLTRFCFFVTPEDIPLKSHYHRQCHMVDKFHPQSGSIKFTATPIRTNIASCVEGSGEHKLD